MYKITFAVWENGEGWQPHNIANRTAKTLGESIDIADKMSAICTEQVISTITDKTGKTVKEMGW